MPGDSMLSWQSWGWGALLLRIVLGVIFLLHGSQKLFGAFGGPGMAGWTGAIESLGLHPAPLLAWMAALAEFGGGLLVLLGILTELGALAIALDMLVAIWKIHGPRGFFITSQPPGYEYNLLIIAVCLALILGGPGYFALWNPFRIHQ